MWNFCWGNVWKVRGFPAITLVFPCGIINVSRPTASFTRVPPATYNLNSYTASLNNTQFKWHKFGFTFFTSGTLFVLRSVTNFLIPTNCTQYVQYTYLSPVTSYMFRCLLHHLQGDRCVNCSRNESFLQRCYTMYNIPCLFLNLQSCYNI